MFLGRRSAGSTAATAGDAALGLDSTVEVDSAEARRVGAVDDDGLVG